LVSEAFFSKVLFLAAKRLPELIESFCWFSACVLMAFRRVFGLENRQ
jgi:hypothetical protein